MCLPLTQPSRKKTHRVISYIPGIYILQADTFQGRHRIQRSFLACPPAHRLQGRCSEHYHVRSISAPDIYIHTYIYIYERIMTYPKAKQFTQPTGPYFSHFRCFDPGIRAQCTSSFTASRCHCGTGCGRGILEISWYWDGSEKAWIAFILVLVD